MDMKAAHPHHTGVKGQQGGSRPAINNNLVKACSATIAKQQADLKPKIASLKNPASRLMGRN